MAIAGERLVQSPMIIGIFFKKKKGRVFIFHLWGYLVLQSSCLPDNPDFVVNSVLASFVRCSFPMILYLFKQKVSFFSLV